MRSDAAIPAAQLKAVITAIYRDADDADWTTLSPQDRSAWYAKWLNDPQVGGILQRFLTPETARSWIKDGPMKEYGNASRGIGRYAAYGRVGGTTHADIAAAALGPGAVVEPDTAGVKPAHCEATDASGGRKYLAWGTSSNFRNLLWAALRASVVNGIQAHVVILEPAGTATPTALMQEQRALAARCEVGLHYMTEKLGQRRSDPESGGVQ